MRSVHAQSRAQRMQCYFLLLCAFGAGVLSLVMPHVLSILIFGLLAVGFFACSVLLLVRETLKLLGASFTKSSERYWLLPISRPSTLAGYYLSALLAWIEYFLILIVLMLALHHILDVDASWLEHNTWMLLLQVHGGRSAMEMLFAIHRLCLHPVVWMAGVISLSLGIATLFFVQALRRHMMPRRSQVGSLREQSYVLRLLDALLWTIGTLGIYGGFYISQRLVPLVLQLWPMKMHLRPDSAGWGYLYRLQDMQVQPFFTLRFVPTLLALFLTMLLFYATVWLFEQEVGE